MSARHPRLRLAAGTLAAVFLLAGSISAAAIGRIATFRGQNAGDQYAISLCNAGDVDGNGYNDLLVGASLEDTGGNAAGKCYLYLGGAFLDTLVDYTLIGYGAGERFGAAVAGGGDLNGDGYADFAVGAIGASDAGALSGRVYVFFGAAVPDTTPDLVFLGGSADARFGEAITLSRDLNGDSYADLVVGAPRADSTGTVTVYFGGVAMDTIPDLVLRGEASGDRFGGAVSTSGDADGDGAADLLVGAERNSAAATWAGRAYLFRGGPALDTVADLTFSGAALGDGFGKSLALTPDLTGNGSDDLVISAPYVDPANFVNDVGRAYVYEGGSALDAVADTWITGEAADDNFGTSVSTTDVDGDGTDDIIVGAPGYGIMEQRGKVYVYYGGVLLDTIPDFTDIGAGAFDALGSAVAGMGLFHFHPDGTAEFVAGGWNINSTGEAWAYGGAPLTTAVGNAVRAPKPLAVSVFPNPFSAQVTIRADHPAAGWARVSVHDVAGRRVATLYDAAVGPGEATIVWRARGPGATRLSAGVYFLRYEHPGGVTVRKLVVVR